MIPLNERHLRRLLHEFVDYHNRDRPHRSLNLEPPTSKPRKSEGSIFVRPVLAGLHHAYERVA